VRLAVMQEAIHKLEQEAEEKRQAHHIACKPALPANRARPMLPWAACAWFSFCNVLSEAAPVQAAEAAEQAADAAAAERTERDRAEKQAAADEAPKKVSAAKQAAAAEMAAANSAVGKNLVEDPGRGASANAQTVGKGLDADKLAESAAGSTRSTGVGAVKEEGESDPEADPMGDAKNFVEFGTLEEDDASAAGGGAQASATGAPAASASTAGASEAQPPGLFEELALMSLEIYEQQLRDLGVQPSLRPAPRRGAAPRLLADRAAAGAVGSGRARV